MNHLVKSIDPLLKKIPSSFVRRTRNLFIPKRNAASSFSLLFIPKQKLRQIYYIWYGHGSLIIIYKQLCFLLLRNIIDLNFINILLHSPLPASLLPYTFFGLLLLFFLILPKSSSRSNS